MYNRYIPQADGTYRRDRIPEPQQPPRRQIIPQDPPHHEEPPCAPEEAIPTPPPCKNLQSCPNRRSASHGAPQHPRKSHPQQEPTALGVGSFLRQLLPKDFDTEDLLIVLLLLLMSADCAEDQNSALLTLALYLFL